MKKRQKKPTKLKLIQGTAQKCRMNPAEPMPDPNIPPPPDFLEGFALAEWSRMSRELFDQGLLTNLDQMALALYCQYAADFKKAVEYIRVNGEVITTSNGNEIQSPWVGIKNTAGKMLKAALSEFGLSPASRASVTVAKSDKKENEFAKAGL